MLMILRSSFSEKVGSIQASTASSKLHSDQITTGPSCDFNIWTSVSPGDNEKFIGITNNKTCQLDPAPTWLVKECSGFVADLLHGYLISHWRQVT